MAVRRRVEAADGVFRASRPTVVTVLIMIMGVFRPSLGGAAVSCETRVGRRGRGRQAFRARPAGSGSAGQAGAGLRARAPAGPRSFFGRSFLGVLFWAFLFGRS